MFGSWDKPNNIKSQIAIIRNDDWKLIEINPLQANLPSGLYNLKTDPFEKNNLYDTNTAKREELKQVIANLK